MLVLTYKTLISWILRKYPRTQAPPLSYARPPIPGSYFRILLVFGGGIS